MSFQSFITEKVAALTASINAIATNAKKIDELPVQYNLKATSKLHVSIDGISESLEVQEIINSIKNNTYNQLISIGKITLVDNVVTVPLDARAQINQVLYNTVSDTVITIPYSGAGLIRTDIFVFNTLSQIIRIAGTETAGLAVRPNIPQNTVLVTEINVTESVVNDPNEPVIGDDLANKLDKDGYIGTARTLATSAKIYENGELQIFRKPGTTKDPTNTEPNNGDWCIGYVEDQFINAEYLTGNKLLLTSYNI